MTNNDQIDFLPCGHFDEWMYQSITALGKAANEIHGAALSCDTFNANKNLAEMIPAIDAIAAEFRTLLGYPGRPDTAEELFVVTTENPRSITGPFESEDSADIFGKFYGGIAPYSIEPLLSPVMADSDDD